MNQRYLPHGKQFGNTCLFLQAGSSALGKHSLFLDPVNNKTFGDHQRQALLCLKAFQLAILISRVTPGTITSWCDFKHQRLSVASNAFSWGEGNAAFSPCPCCRSLLITRWLSLPAAMLLLPARSRAQLPPASPLKGSRALMTSHALTSNRYVFENRIRPHTSTTALKGFSPHLLLSVLYTQVEEWHKAPPLPARIT